MDQHDEGAGSGPHRKILETGAAAAAIGGVPIAVAQLPVPRAHVFALATAAVLAVAGLSVLLLRRQPARHRRASALHLAGVVLATALGSVVLGGAWNGGDAPGAVVPGPAACKSWASFVSPKPDQVINRQTKIEGRARLCAGDSLWVTTISEYGHVSRSRDPIKPDEQDNWSDPLRALMSKNPPPRVTYCLMATDADTTTEWRNRFDGIGDAGTLDLAGLTRPDRCLDQVTVVTDV
jgi:hypothetical protein